MVAMYDNLSPLAQRQRLRGSETAAVAGLSPAERQTLQLILADDYEYMDHPLFERPRGEAEREIFEEPAPIAQPDTSWYHPAMNLSDSPSPGRSGSKTLTAAEERVIFAQFNYCRFRVSEIRREVLDDGAIQPRKARELLKWHRRAEGYRDQIAGLNLALVLAMAKRARMSDVDFADMISEGNMALLRSVDKFDVTRGFKFSTYACRAILKAFSRQGQKQTRYRSIFPTDFDPKLEKSNWQEEKNLEHERDCVDELRSIIRQNKAELSQIERDVIERRFAVGDHAALDKHGDPKPLTLEQVGRIIGVTKERVRQIQNKALEKIRHSLEGDFLRR